MKLIRILSLLVILTLAYAPHAYGADDEGPTSHTRLTRVTADFGGESPDKDGNSPGNSQFLEYAEEIYGALVSHTQNTSILGSFRNELDERTLTLNKFSFYITAWAAALESENPNPTLIAFPVHKTFLEKGWYDLTYDQAKEAAENVFTEEGPPLAYAVRKAVFEPCSFGFWAFPYLEDEGLFKTTDYVEAVAQRISLYGVSVNPEVSVHEGIVKGRLAFLAHDQTHLAAQFFLHGTPAECATHGEQFSNAVASMLEKIKEKTPEEPELQDKWIGTLFAFHEFLEAYRNNYKFDPTTPQSAETQLMKWVVKGVYRFFPDTLSSEWDHYEAYLRRELQDPTVKCTEITQETIRTHVLYEAEKGNGKLSVRPFANFDSQRKFAFSLIGNLESIMHIDIGDAKTFDVLKVRTHILKAVENLAELCEIPLE